MLCASFVLISEYTFVKKLKGYAIPMSFNPREDRYVRRKRGINKNLFNTCKNEFFQGQDRQVTLLFRVLNQVSLRKSILSNI